MKKILIMFAVFVLVHLSATDVLADTDEKLNVGVTMEGGQSVMVKNGAAVYSASPVVFTPVSDKGENYYSICTDDAAGFGEYIKPDGPQVTLYPDENASPSGRWKIRFLNRDDDGAEKVSDVFCVVFDTVIPHISFDDEEMISGWIKSGSILHFNVTDEGSGISRIMIRRGSSVEMEEHFSEDDSITSRDVSFTIPEDSDVINQAYIECTDFAGNASRMSFEYRMDEQSPEINTGGIANGEHLKEAGRLSVEAFDNSDEVYIDYSVERDVGGQILTTEVQNASKDTSVCFDEEGRYTVTLYARDGAGNRSRQIRREFVLDGTAPGITIEGAADNSLHKSGAVISIGVRERMYENTKVDIKLIKTAFGKSEIIPISGYDMAAPEDTRVVNINSDGDYAMIVSAADPTGNRSSATTKFRVDSTAPKITIDGLNDKEATSKSPVFNFRSAEMFYDSTIMTATLEKKEGDKYTPVSSTSRFMTSPEDMLSISCEREGKYRLTCRAEDLCKNTSQRSVDFTLDRTPPVISGLSGIDKGSFRSFSLTKKLSDLASDLLGVNVSAFVNDTSITEKDVIEKEGKYILSVIAEDEAGNVSEECATFMVDNTPPQIVLTGFDRDGNIRKGSRIGVGLLEECDELLDVKFAEKNVAINDDNTAGISVDDYGEYDLAVKARDPAGNITDTVVHTSCYMSDSPLSGYFAAGKIIPSEIVKSDKNDIDGASLAIGIISVLSGTYGLTWRASLRD